jgi:tripartite-type tricarboxylate transporter receptor subunit TctC
MRLALLRIALIAAAVLTSAPLTAAEYPTRPITLVVPYAAGGGNDVIARIVAERMSASLAQTIVIENRGGAGGTIATRQVAKAEPDGTTLLIATSSLAINPSLYPNAGYDPRKDFAPIGLIGWQPSVLTVHPSLPARTPSELIAYAKANPGKVNYGFVPGTVGHMTAEMFARSAGIELTRVPYKGNGQAIGDLIGGHLSMMVLSLSPILGNVKDGKLFALAVTTPDRSKLLPDVPTIAESTVPGFSAAIRYGLAAPAGTSAAIVDRLARELRAAVMSEDVRERMLSEGAQPMASTPAEYAAEIDSEERKWSALVKSLNLKME